MADINGNLKNDDFREKRQFIRIPFQKKISYQVCYNNFTSESSEASTENISTGGIMFKTKWPPQSLAVIAIDLDIAKLRQYIKTENLESKIHLDEVYVKNGKVFGEVIRIKEYPESGYYDVALRLILKNERHKKKKFNSNNNQQPGQYK